MTEVWVALAPSLASELFRSLEAATEGLGSKGPATSCLRQPSDLADLREIWTDATTNGGDSTNLILGWQLGRGLRRFGSEAMQAFELELPNDSQTVSALRACLMIADGSTVDTVLLWELERLNNALIDLYLNLGERVP